MDESVVDQVDEATQAKDDARGRQVRAKGATREGPEESSAPADDETPESAAEHDRALDDETAADEPPEAEDDDSEPVSVVVELPPTAPHETPEDEAAVAIPDVAVDPSNVGAGAIAAAPVTRSITVVTATPAAPPLSSGPNPLPDVVVATPSAAPATGIEAQTSAPAAYQTSRRDRLRGELGDQPEPATMLTADRILDARYLPTTQPTGTWNRFVYALTFHLVNLGDSPKERARKELDHRIRKQFEGGTRFVPVLTRKGGVGKTTVTTLLGMALAQTRDDRVIAIDANPDRGTLSERVPKFTHHTVRDVVHKAPSIASYTDFSDYVTRDETRLDVLASDTDPNLSEAFDENDYNVVADLVSRYYSVALTDCGTGIVHSVMRATLQRADSIVVVSGGSVDESRLASETLSWLDANGYSDLVRNAIVAINTATQGTNLVKLSEIESHFRSRVREIVRIPYDPLLAAGSVVSYKDLKPLTKEAARQLAALVIEGMPASREQ